MDPKIVSEVQKLLKQEYSDTGQSKYAKSYLILPKQESVETIPTYQIDSVLQNIARYLKIDSSTEFCSVKELQGIREKYLSLQKLNDIAKDQVKSKKDHLVSLQEKLKDRLNDIKQEGEARSERQKVIQEIIDMKRKGKLVKLKINLCDKNTGILMKTQEVAKEEYRRIEETLHNKEDPKKHELINQREYLQIELEEFKEKAKDFKHNIAKYEISKEERSRMEELKKKEHHLKTDIKNLNDEMKQLVSKNKIEQDKIIANYSEEIETLKININRLRNEEILRQQNVAHRNESVFQFMNHVNNVEYGSTEFKRTKHNDQNRHIDRDNSTQFNKSILNNESTEYKHINTELNRRTQNNEYNDNTEFNKHINRNYTSPFNRQIQSNESAEYKHMETEFNRRIQNNEHNTDFNKHINRPQSTDIQHNNNREHFGMNNKSTEIVFENQHALNIQNPAMVKRKPTDYIDETEIYKLVNDKTIDVNGKVKRHGSEAEVKPYENRHRNVDKEINENIHQINEDAIRVGRRTFTIGTTNPSVDMNGYMGKQWILSENIKTHSETNQNETDTPVRTINENMETQNKFDVREETDTPDKTINENMVTQYQLGMRDENIEKSVKMLDRVGKIHRANQLSNVDTRQNEQAKEMIDGTHKSVNPETNNLDKRLNDLESIENSDQNVFNENSNKTVYQKDPTKNYENEMKASEIQTGNAHNPTLNNEKDRNTASTYKRERHENSSATPEKIETSQKVKEIVSSNDLIKISIEKSREFEIVPLSQVDNELLKEGCFTRDSYELKEYAFNKQLDKSAGNGDVFKFKDKPDVQHQDLDREDADVFKKPNITQKSYKQQITRNTENIGRMEDKQTRGNTHATEQSRQNAITNPRCNTPTLQSMNTANRRNPSNQNTATLLQEGNVQGFSNTPTPESTNTPNRRSTSNQNTATLLQEENRQGFKTDIQSHQMLRDVPNAPRCDTPRVQRSREQKLYPPNCVPSSPRSRSQCSNLQQRFSSEKILLTPRQDKNNIPSSPRHTNNKRDTTPTDKTLATNWNSSNITTWSNRSSSPVSQRNTNNRPSYEQTFKSTTPRDDHCGLLDTSTTNHQIQTESQRNIKASIQNLNETDLQRSATPQQRHTPKLSNATALQRGASMTCLTGRKLFMEENANETVQQENEYANLIRENYDMNERNLQMDPNVKTNQLIVRSNNSYTQNTHTTSRVPGNQGQNNNQNVDQHESNTRYGNNNAFCNDTTELTRMGDNRTPQGYERYDGTQYKTNQSYDSTNNRALQRYENSESTNMDVHRNWPSNTLFNKEKVEEKISGRHFTDGRFKITTELSFKLCNTIVPRELKSGKMVLKTTQGVTDIEIKNRSGDGRGKWNAQNGREYDERYRTNQYPIRRMETPNVEVTERGVKGPIGNIERYEKQKDIMEAQRHERINKPVGTPQRGVQKDIERGVKGRIENEMDPERYERINKSVATPQRGVQTINRSQTNIREIGHIENDRMNVAKEFGTPKKTGQRFEDKQMKNENNRERDTARQNRGNTSGSQGMNSPMDNFINRKMKKQNGDNCQEYIQKEDIQTDTDAKINRVETINPKDKLRQEDNENYEEAKNTHDQTRANKSNNPNRQSGTASHGRTNEHNQTNTGDKIKQPFNKLYKADTGNHTTASRRGSNEHNQTTKGDKINQLNKLDKADTKNHATHGITNEHIQTNTRDKTSPTLNKLVKTDTNDHTRLVSTESNSMEDKLNRFLINETRNISHILNKPKEILLKKKLPPVAKKKNVKFSVQLTKVYEMPNMEGNKRKGEDETKIGVIKKRKSRKLFSLDDED